MVLTLTLWCCCPTPQVKSTVQNIVVPDVVYIYVRCAFHNSMGIQAPRHLWQVSSLHSWELRTSGAAWVIGNIFSSALQSTVGVVTSGDEEVIVVESQESLREKFNWSVVVNIFLLSIFMGTRLLVLYCGRNAWNEFLFLHHYFWVGVRPHSRIILHLETKLWRLQPGAGLALSFTGKVKWLFDPYGGAATQGGCHSFFIFEWKGGCVKCGKKLLLWRNNWEEI